MNRSHYHVEADFEEGYGFCHASPDTTPGGLVRQDLTQGSQKRLLIETHIDLQPRYYGIETEPLQITDKELWKVVASPILPGLNNSGRNDSVTTSVAKSFQKRSATTAEYICHRAHFETVSDELGGINRGREFLRANRRRDETRLRSHLSLFQTGRSC